MTDDVPSPCIAICVLNEQDLCEGCYRSIQEITEWTAYSADEKRAVIARAGERRKADGMAW